MVDGDLSGRRVVITGASSGIGAAVARAVVQAGGSVGLIARRAERLAELAQELGDRALLLPCDVTNTAKLIQVVDEAALRFGGLDGVISNAGHGFLGQVAQGDPANWTRFIATNLTACFVVVQAALRHFPESGPRDVIVVGSTAARTPGPLLAIYSAAKRGLAAFSDSLRLELAPRKIRVSLFEPGGTATEVFEHIVTEGDTTFVMDEVMAGAGYSLMSAEETAAIVTFMLSRPAHFGINNVVVRPTGQFYP